MPQIIITRAAARGLSRCQEFLQKKNPVALKAASTSIRDRLNDLLFNPYIGRLRDEKLRELPIEFGNSGYLALYRYEESTRTIYLLAFRHQKEAEYEAE